MTDTHNKGRLSIYSTGLYQGVGRLSIYSIGVFQEVRRLSIHSTSLYQGVIIPKQSTAVFAPTHRAIAMRELRLGELSL